MKITFILNGNKEIIDVPPDKPLLKVLRENFSLKSVKEGCGRGECGTCSALFDGKAVTTCMIAAGQVNGRTVETLEGLEKKDEFKKIQEAFMKGGAVQCGFCTPGFLISAYSLLTETKNPDREMIREAISGNICRCTGYSKIVDSIELASNYIEKIWNT